MTFIELCPGGQKKIDELVSKATSQSELEFIFSRREGVGYDDYLNVLKYFKYREQHDKLEIRKSDTLDVSYTWKENGVMTVYRITLENDINPTIETMHTRNNHIIFRTLLSKLGKNITLMMKTKDSENFIDLDEFEMRVRLSEETAVPAADMKYLEELDYTTANDIIFRYKRRTSLIIDKHVRIDLTSIKMHGDIDRLERAIDRYELEVEHSGSKPTDMTKMYKEATILLKIFQNSNFLITSQKQAEILSQYADLFAIKKNAIMLDGRKPVSLEIQHVTSQLPHKYAVTDKADGDRHFLFIYNGVWLISNNLFVRDTGIKVDPKWNNTTLDGEYIFLQRFNRHVFMVFDCMFVAGEDTRVISSFMERIHKADEVITACFTNKKHAKFDWIDYTGGFDAGKVVEFNSKQIDRYMDALNHDILIDKQFCLIRRKFFIQANGVQANEIFKYAELIWKRYVNDTKLGCPYILDGLIFQPLEQKYITQVKDSKMSEYKWKPMNKNSIDFFITIDISKETGRDVILFDNTEDDTVNKPYKIVKLHVGESIRSVEQPVLFQEKDKKYLAYLYLQDGEIRDLDGDIIQNNTVVEFYYNTDPTVPEKHRWVPLRTRYDKTEVVHKYRRGYGNYNTIANATWRSMSNPFTLEDISTLAKDNMYQRHNDSLRGKVDLSVIQSENKENVYYQFRTNLGKPMRNFHNWIKSVLIYTYCNSEYAQGRNLSVLDLASGRGGDIMKFYYAHVSLLVGVEIEETGISNPVDGALSRYAQFRKQNVKFPPMFFIHGNMGAQLDLESQMQALGTMSDANATMIKKFFSTDPSQRVLFDRINCQFAIHYVLGDQLTFNNFLDNVNNYLKPGGFMLITCFDAEKVIARLGDQDKFTSYYTNASGEKKVLFEVIKKFETPKDKKITTGFAIDVHNALYSNEGVYNMEYLVHRQFMIEQFKEKCNMDLVDTDLFSNQVIVHEPYFRGAAMQEENVKTRQFLQNVAEYYDATDINRACYEMSALNRYYVFRKRDAEVVKAKPSKKQTGGGVVQLPSRDHPLEEVEQMNTSNFIRRELSSANSFYSAIHNIIQTEGLIPATVSVTEFYKDQDIPITRDYDITPEVIKQVGASLEINHEENGKIKPVINKMNFVILDRDCDGTISPTTHAVMTGGKIDRSVPVMLMYYDGEMYQPVYKVKEGGMVGVFDSKMKFIRALME